MKILSVVILYYPSQELLKRNLDCIVDDVDTLLLWNNTPQKMSCPYVHDKVIYVNNGVNVGLPKAYNYAWRYAQDNGYTHVLTMDQDSVFRDFHSFVEAVRTRREIAVFAPNIPAPGSIQLTIPCQEVLHVINSGALIPIEVLSATDGYSEEFFMDMVDDEFCYHARALGYKIYQFRDYILKQQYGHISSIKLLNHTIARMTNYSAMRIYGICRNKLILWRRYDVPTVEKAHVLWCDLKAFIKMLCFEQNKWSKCCAYCCGYYDGILNRPSRIHKFMR